MNTVPGIRMEERSPGSYRLSIRGSLLRSPFGVRNVKMYLNDLPFTDASGNTYLNLIDPALLQRAEILKGPDGSLFGANSGGVVLIDSHQNDSTLLRGSISAGSYGLFRQHVVAGGSNKKFSWNFGEAFQRSDGYRQQSAMRRLSLLGSAKLKYGSANSVKLTMLLSDLHYETPGGLTKAQYDDNPIQARPGTEFTPGAVEQKAGIYNTTFFTGLTNEFKFSPFLRHVVSVFGTITDYENPFITNYEYRHEANTGLRTFLEYFTDTKRVDVTIDAGIESQTGSQEISNHENLGGTADPFILSKDDITIGQHVFFSKLRVDWFKRFTVETAVSLNVYNYSFRGIDKRELSNEWMPRLAASYRFAPNIAARGSISRGYSPPTIAEIRPSGGTVNEALNAESGWNKEIGGRVSLWNGRLQADASYFWYNLEDAIVRRTDFNDAEIFLNSGGTKQRGAEFLVNSVLLPEQSSGFVRRLALNVSYTWSRFVFKNYRTDSESYSNNRVTGVPRTNVVTGLSVDLTHRVNIYVQSIFTSRIPLNDANSEYAERYELLQAKIGWTGVKRDRLILEFFAGADNLLDQKYSLGNDLNAFGGRYYNAAPLRNFYGGINVTLP